uniref:Uncharacterized protein n=1 Tax=Anguilla anguilla TaxID=7936 RepID=A0A0E9PF05_ANGAN
MYRTCIHFYTSEWIIYDCDLYCILCVCIMNWIFIIQ